MATGNVEITILDGGTTIVVPGATVQVVIGPAASGTDNAIVSTQNANTLASTYVAGELMEAAALTCLAGGTVIAIKSATDTPGSFRGQITAINIVSSTNATPIVVTTGANTLATGDIVTIAGHLVNTAANGTWKIVRLSSTTFSLVGAAGVGVGAATGTVAPQGVNQIGTGTSEVTASGTPNDTYYIYFKVINGGTVGITGITFQLSIDAGRNFGPVLSLGTANSFVVDSTGITLNFSAGTFVASDYATIGTVGPKSSVGSVVTCLTALLNSQFAVSGFGSMHICGVFNGADAATLQIELDVLKTNVLYTRAIVDARDASPAHIWGGTAETQSVWSAAIAADFSAADANRDCVNGGYYNMPSAFRTASTGTPRMRRGLGWALAVRGVTIPPQRHAGAVRDGSLSSIVVDPTGDPADGFVYYDGRLSTSLNAARFCSARTRLKLPGYYIVQPNLMSHSGSVFSILPYGNVMDVACTIVNQVGQQEINSDIRLNQNGTIFENEAKSIENTIYGVIKTDMIDVAMVSSATVTVNRTNNILSESIVRVHVSILARGYVLEMDVDIGFDNPFSAGQGQ